MTLRMLLALSLAFALQQAPAPLQPSAQVPKPAGTTPTACLKEVRDYSAARRAEVPSVVPVSATAPNPQAAAQNQARLVQLRQIDVDKTWLAKTCAAPFDAKTVAGAELTSLSLLYSEAAQPDLAKAAIERAITIKGQAAADRATTLSTAISTIMREPKGDERNARLEKLVDELDTLPDMFFAQKFAAHQTMNGYYRGDDIDAGIIKHSTWLIDAAKSCDPDARKIYAPKVVYAYIDMAEAWAGQGMNDKALDLLRQAPKDLADVPGVEKTVASTLARYMIVGTAGAPITAPVWLNMPAGTRDLPMTGQVTLLEFSAHWCGPCKESYPGINRLRATYESKGFRVVLATELYGYFSTERNLAPEAEVERDRAYFAEHGLNVPVAIGNKTPAPSRNEDGSYTYHRDPNSDHYEVGGIPQIQLIDKHGKIRLIMVGYDDANEAKLAGLIEGLLKEK
jgi:thiol-disulfide isomerase/thioredoxin